MSPNYYDDSVQQRNERGEWVPSIPLPAFGRHWGREWLTCACGEGFRSSAAYRGHFALVHILGLL